MNAQQIEIGPLPENPDQAGFFGREVNPDVFKATTKFNRAIQNLATSDIQPVAENAKRAITLLRGGIFQIRQGGFSDPTVFSHFQYLHWQDLYGIDLDKPRGAPNSFYATLTLGTVDDPVQIEADLVRTTSLLAQFPNKGFQGRYRDFYTRAFNTQAKWLNANDILTVSSDPRNTPRNELLIKFIGPTTYLGDMGFKDWQRAIDAFGGAEDKMAEDYAENEHHLKENLWTDLEEGSNPGQDLVSVATREYQEGMTEIEPLLDYLNGFGKLKLLKDSTGDFINARARLVPEVVALAMEQPSFKKVIRKNSTRAFMIASGVVACLLEELTSPYVHVTSHSSN